MVILLLLNDNYVFVFHIGERLRGFLSARLGCGSRGSRTSQTKDKHTGWSSLLLRLAPRIFILE